MSFYISDKFQCKDTWELIDSDDCTRPIAELVKWSNGWTIRIFRSLTSEAETIVLDFVSQNRRGGEADQLHVIRELEQLVALPVAPPEPALPVWLL